MSCRLHIARGPSHAMSTEQVVVEQYTMHFATNASLQTAPLFTNRASSLNKAERPPQAGLRILVVDDEPAILYLTERVLKRQSFEVETAPHGAAALELLQRASFDLIISDLDMPEMDGLTLWQEVQRRWPKTAPALLLMTGSHPDNSSYLYCQQNNIPYLNKPFTLEELSQSVSHLLA